jgi:hypothetical protein
MKVTNAGYQKQKEKEGKMSQVMKWTAAVSAAVILTACATTHFASTWKEPSAARLGKMKGKTVVACVAVQDEYLRHEAEDALTAELNKRGVKGVPSYSLLPPGVKDEALAKAAFEKIDAAAAVVMRPVATQAKTSVYAGAYYAGPSYGGFWGGYWGYGWASPYGAVSVQTDTILVVETLFYSLEQNKLVWTGLSKTTNPSKVGPFIRELVASAVWEMNKAKVF